MKNTAAALALAALVLAGCDSQKANAAQDMSGDTTIQRIEKDHEQIMKDHQEIMNQHKTMQEDLQQIKDEHKKIMQDHQQLMDEHQMIKNGNKAANNM